MAEGNYVRLLGGTITSGYGGIQNFALNDMESMTAGTITAVTGGSVSGDCTFGQSTIIQR